MEWKIPKILNRAGNYLLNIVDYENKKPVTPVTLGMPTLEVIKTATILFLVHH